MRSKALHLQLLSLLLISGLALAGCSGAVVPALGSATTATSTPATAVPPASGETSPSNGDSGQGLSTTDPAYAAIQSVIKRANQAQETAFAKSDPSAMIDTATNEYYQQMAQINRDMASGGVSAIKLVKIEWGPVSLSNATAAQATTYETWQSTFADGSTDQSRDHNVYTLVLDQGQWKILSDDQPDSGNNTPGPGAPRPPTPGSPVPPPSSVRQDQVDRSRNWSGYQATGGKFTAVDGTWTVPESDGNGGYATGATWVGIGGVDSPDLIQAGTEQTSSRSGQALYRAWIEMLPHPSQPVTLTVRPGDSVSVSIEQTGADQWLISMKNNTTAQAYQTTVRYASSLSSAEWVVEAPSAGRRVLPLDNFGRVEFSAASAMKNGKPVNLTQAGARAIAMIDATGVALATPSAIDADGTGFSVARTDAAPSTGAGATFRHPAVSGLARPGSE